MKDFEPMVGRLYYDRKSNKRGMLYAGDSQKNTYTLVDNETKEDIVVNRTIFRNNWRPVEEDARVACEPDTSKTDPVNDRGTEDQIVEFVEKFNEKRDAKIEQYEPGECYVFTVEGVPVLKTTSGHDDFIFVKMLPDLYTYSDFSKFAMKSPKFDLRDADHMTVKLAIHNGNIIDILQAISSAAGEINLYGYKN